jgi:hypothetical protein
MTYVAGRLYNFLGVSVSVALMLGCGGKYSNDGTQQSATTGGNTGATLTAAQGGSLGLGGTSSIIAVGGTHVTTTSTQSSTGGNAPTTGGTHAGAGGNNPVTTGGAVSTAGTTGSATGGKFSVGGSASTGGTAVAGAASTGGKSWSGGAASTGGKSPAGGTVGTGGTSPNAGGSPAGGSAGSGAAGGDPLTSFCSGSESKVSYQGQQVLAPVTSYQSALVFDCCMSDGVNWHTKTSLGFDLEVEVISMLGGTSSTGPGVYPIDNSFGPLRAVAHRSADSAYGVATRGTAELITAYSFNSPWKLGLCLEVSDPTSDLFGTRLYVPQVTMIPYSSFSRFQIFLLNDSSILSEQAAAVPLDSLVLAANPLLDLREIAYVVQTTGEVGLNPGQKYGDSVSILLKNRIDHLPFVVLADGARIYLGTFMNMSQRVPYGPLIMFNEVTSDGFFIRAPMQGTDLRNDSRIIQALTETGKLIP